MAEYASNAKANAALTTGIIGTSLGAIANAGGIMNILGVQPGARNADPGDRPVTRYEMQQIKENFDLKTENALLKANQYADARANGLQAQIGQQAVWNATQEGIIRCQAEQIARLYGVTKLMIPEINIAYPSAPPTVASGGTTTAGSGT